MPQGEVAARDNGDSSHTPSFEGKGTEESSSSVNALVSADMASLPLGYFTSAFFLGTMVASGLALSGVSLMTLLPPKTRYSVIHGNLLTTEHREPGVSLSRLLSFILSMQTLGLTLIMSGSAWSIP